MSWFFWMLAAMYVLNIIGNIYMVDKPRTPLTRTSAMVGVAVSTAMIYGICYYGGLVR